MKLEFLRNGKIGKLNVLIVVILSFLRKVTAQNKPAQQAKKKRGAEY